MNRFEITAQAIDPDVFRQRLQDPACGAYVQFDGWVRNHNEGQRVLRLEYEVYEPLAVKEGQGIIDEAIERFGVNNACCVHRSGLLEITDLAVVVAVSSPHRDAAFQACRYIIDETKARLPIWKKEHYENGEAEWVNCKHHGPGSATIPQANL
ncbi:MAG: molybdenum cofactor biosynthesis protein MoaE [Proteobacteria bacterium]|nr:molybdenum cofactor biosynthesis protein MoaE [Pseudomonadota bacterium]